MTAPRPPIAFDRVEMTERDGRVLTLDPDGFTELGLAVRVRCILEKRLRFFYGSREVPMKAALASLQ